jgi:CBS domain-containing protein
VGERAGVAVNARISRDTGICIGELPTRSIPMIPARLSMAAARKIARLKRVSLLFVEQDERLVGLLDARALARAPDDAAVAASMAPIRVCLHPAMSAARALDIFIRAGATALPVTAGAFLIGAVTRDDVERAVGRRGRWTREARAGTPAAA